MLVFSRVTRRPLLSFHMPTLGKVLYPHCFQLVNSISSPTSLLSSSPIFPLQLLTCPADAANSVGPTVTSSPPPANLLPLLCFQLLQKIQLLSHKPLSITIHWLPRSTDTAPKHLCPLPPPPSTPPSSSSSLSYTKTIPLVS